MSLNGPFHLLVVFFSKFHASVKLTISNLFNLENINAIDELLELQSKY